MFFSIVKNLGKLQPPLRFFLVSIIIHASVGVAPCLDTIGCVTVLQYFAKSYFPSCSIVYVEYFINVYLNFFILKNLPPPHKVQ